MDLKTFIFTGQSGCGKGTQVKLLMDHLKSVDTEHNIFYLQTGQHFREFVKGETYAAQMAREAQENGDRQPDFLAMWIWSDVFVKNLDGTKHLVVDGSPRSLNEAKNLDMAMKFFKRVQPYVVYINVSAEWSEKHLLEREEGRADDNIEGIRKRLSWFKDDVMPAVEYYRRNPDYRFLDINGEQTIEEVNKEIFSKVF